MIANLDRVLKLVRGEHADNVAGQTDMFGTTTDTLNLVELPEYSDVERLWYERKVLGTFLSGHPVLAYQKKYLHKITHRMNEIDFLPYTDWPSMQPVVVAALVVKVYENRFNTSVKLSDETGSAEIQFYRDEADRARWLLKKDMIIAVKASVKRDGSWSGVNGKVVHKIGEFSLPLG
jgi:DNA polymerase-3 subunit alpha